MSLSREEKEEFVRDLYYNKGKTYHEIAKQARVSLRDIKGILNGGTQDAQGEQSLYKAAQAYEMFSKGKSPMEVAVTLDLREPEVTQLYRESWTLRQIHDLNQIYLETGGNLAPFLKLYKSSKAAGYSAEDVVWLLGVANNDMQGLEYRYHNLKSEVASLETKKTELGQNCS